MENSAGCEVRFLCQIKNSVLFIRKNVNLHTEDFVARPRFVIRYRYSQRNNKITKFDLHKTIKTLNFHFESFFLRIFGIRYSKTVAQIQDLFIFLLKIFIAQEIFQNSAAKYRKRDVFFIK
jgi:hypothetical protein